MDNTYDFSWLIKEIDESMIFILRDGECVLGSYQIREIVTNVIDDVNVKFANINDLTNFINYASIRFVDSINNDNFVDIPIRKLKSLYDSANKITKETSNSIRLNEIDAFGIYNNHAVSSGYAIIPYLINFDKNGEDFNDTINIAANFLDLSMNQKIIALEKLNLINYRKSKENSNSRK